MNNEVIEAWKTLSSVGKPEMTFRIIRNDSWGKERIKTVVDLIGSMMNFNEKNNQLIAKTFEEFFNSLPKAYYNENNVNNGNYFFDKIILHDDDYILLQGNTMSGLNEATEKDLREKIYTYGKKNNADVHELIVDKGNFGLTQYTIKFWWD